MLKDITPKSQSSCFPIPGCPAIFDLDSKYYILVGELLDIKSIGIENRVSKGEAAIKVPRAIIDNILMNR